MASRDIGGHIHCRHKLAVRYWPAFTAAGALLAADLTKDCQRKAIQPGRVSCRYG